LAYFYEVPCLDRDLFGQIWLQIFTAFLPDLFLSAFWVIERI